MITGRNFIVVFLILHAIHGVFAQTDSLIFKGGNVVTGEIKKMERGVLEIDAPFGDENLKIKWLDIAEIYTGSTFLVSVKERVFQGSLATISEGEIRVFSQDSVLTTCSQEDIVYLIQVKDRFADRFSAALEFGFNLSKAQGLRQFSIRSSAGYKAPRWTLEASYNVLRSTQDEAEAIRRADGLLNYRRLLIRRWYGIATIATLSNSEQLLDIRANSQLGLGNFLFSSNRAYWGIKTGVNNNLEKFSNNPDTRSSWEGFLGTELNLYNVGDIDLLFNYMGYTGITDGGRYRADINFDLKYDLPLDFFIRMGVSYNYDNKPAADASNSDYIIRTGIGWEW